VSLDGWLESVLVRRRSFFFYLLVDGNYPVRLVDI